MTASANGTRWFDSTPCHKATVIEIAAGATVGCWRWKDRWLMEQQAHIWHSGKTLGGL